MFFNKQINQKTCYLIYGYFEFKKQIIHELIIQTKLGDRGYGVKKLTRIFL